MLRSPLRFAAGVALSSLTLALAACAGGAPREPVAATAGQPSLESIRPSLRSLEDSLVLDLLIGYRELASGRDDAEALRRARTARNQLDYMIRHDGVKDRGGEGRVLETPPGEKATLGETVSQMSRALLRIPSGPAEGERAREILRHRQELSSLVEDAEWVLTLAAAQEGALPDDTKRALRRVHEAYSGRAPHAAVASQVTALLRTVQDERLRKELKKLANRSWERERREKGAASAPAPETGAYVPAPIPDFDAPPAPTPASTANAAADSALSPDAYCDARRAEAADLFAAARTAKGETARALLTKSLAALDDCLSRHPGTPAAERARGNRDRVQGELQAADKAAKEGAAR